MRKVKIPKGGGRYRLIYVPSPAEKAQLRRLVAHFNPIAKAQCPYAHAFIPGRSAHTAALALRRAVFLVSADIQDWFDNITETHLRRAGVAENVIKQVLVDGATRQGLPTSPVMANLAAAAMDQRIVAALPPGCAYARYADDLNVACPTREAAEVARQVLDREIRAEGWKPHPNKWSMQWRGAGRLVVCGIVFDETGKLAATRTARRKLRAARHAAQITGRVSTSLIGLTEWSMMRLPLEALVRRRYGGRDPGKDVLTALGVPTMALERAKRGRRLENRATLEMVLKEFDVGAFNRAVEFFEKNEVFGYGTHALAFRVVSTFGKSWTDWIEGAKQRNISLHDAVFWLPLYNTPSSGLGAALFKWRREIPGIAQRTRDLSLIASAWQSLSDEERRQPFAALLATLRARVYINATSYEFASEAARWGVSVETYYVFEAKWLKHRNVEYETIPRGVVGQQGAYRAVILARDDPRALWAGYHTNCCQHPLGAGSECAWHAALSPLGAVLAVFDNSQQMVAQSWLWREGNIVVADNVETLRDVKDIDLLYEQAARNIVGKLQITEFRVGADGDIDIPSRWPKVPRVRLSNYHGYTDADKQYLIYRLEPELELGQSDQ